MSVLFFLCQIPLSWYANALIVGLWDCVFRRNFAVSIGHNM